jgi:hypothetical protein
VAAVRQSADLDVGAGVGRQEGDSRH